MRGMVVAVTGGTGFIGRHLIRQLCAEEVQVRVLCRNPERALVLKPLGEVGQVTPIPTDLGQDEQLARALSGADAVVNLVGILHERRAGDFQRLHAQLPERIGRLAPAGARLVQISAIGADSGSRSIYARTKAAGEQGLRQARPDAVILRPSVVFGPEDQFLNRFAAMSATLPFLPAIGGGRTRFQPVYVGDVARAIVAALAGQARPGAIYELGGPEVLSFREILVWLLRVLGRNRRIVNVPFGVAEFLGRILQHLPTPPLTVDQVVQLRSDNVANPDLPGLAELGVPPTPLEVAGPPYLQLFARSQVRTIPAQPS
ncbi:complex I NDUFA9 subunit family protein [Geminicoccus flavidas]|uniref:complex I NDUFA9 subunit family protein n=1 Tax=Geminicoccus flavidas TaxID=2506407 RepID=UPI001357BB69|nr:complex I NDUFA9 subunit family protein [Geminicoccus flavidas]